MSRLIGVYGTGGCGRGIMPLLAAAKSDVSRLVYIDDRPPSAMVNGIPVMEFADFVAQPETEKFACLAIASGTVRRALADRCEQAGVTLAEVRAANVIEMDDVIIGEGACLSPFVTLTSNIRIGKCFHANLYSYVEHDCIIGDFVTFAPGVKCNGNVIIEDDVYVGSGAVLRNGTPDNPLRIGAGAIIGMGAVVTRSIARGVTVVGNPARIMQIASLC
ncbi:MAG: acetyltransferase [Alphaproteobacteria bacterium]|nr:acetyltransferase [Alphaproteobacteria bacterium]